MEYIDGEDLASLIKRIGHLTNEKALDIARQLAAPDCGRARAGSAARDLKPPTSCSTDMARAIYDFGLAIVAEDEAQAGENRRHAGLHGAEQLEARELDP